MLSLASKSLARLMSSTADPLANLLALLGPSDARPRDFAPGEFDIIVLFVLLETTLAESSSCSSCSLPPNACPASDSNNEPLRAEAPVLEAADALAEVALAVPGPAEEAAPPVATLCVLMAGGSREGLGLPAPRFSIDETGMEQSH